MYRYKMCQISNQLLKCFLRYWAETKIQDGCLAAILDFGPAWNSKVHIIMITHISTIQMESPSLMDFEICFTLFCHILADLCYRIASRSEIQYGRHAAILDFLSRALSQEGFEQSIRNFYSLLAHISGPALLTFRSIQNPIWPPRRHLGFSFARIISRRIQPINLKSLQFIATY